MGQGRRQIAGEKEDREGAILGLDNEFAFDLSGLAGFSVFQSFFSSLVSE